MAARRGTRTFVGRTGRCGETAFLEFHHVAPYAAGGAATAANIQLRCRAHNQYEARLFFGDMFVRERRDVWESSTASDIVHDGASYVDTLRIRMRHQRSWRLNNRVHLPGGVPRSRPGTGVS